MKVLLCFLALFVFSSTQSTVEEWTKAITAGDKDVIKSQVQELRTLVSTALGKGRKIWEQLEPFKELVVENLLINNNGSVEEVLKAFEPGFTSISAMEPTIEVVKGMHWVAERNNDSVTPVNSDTRAALLKVGNLLLQQFEDLNEMGNAAYLMYKLPDLKGKHDPESVRKIREIGWQFIGTINNRTGFDALLPVDERLDDFLYLLSHRHPPKNDDFEDWTPAIKSKDKNRVRVLLNEPSSLLTGALDKGRRLMAKFEALRFDLMGYLLVNETVGTQEAVTLLTTFKRYFVGEDPGSEAALAHLWLLGRAKDSITPVTGDVREHLEYAKLYIEQQEESLDRIGNGYVILEAELLKRPDEAKVKQLAIDFIERVGRRSTYEKFLDARDSLDHFYDAWIDSIE